MNEHISSSHSVSSAGEIIASAGSSDIPNSPTSLSQQHCPVTPVLETATPFPQNPFDSFVETPPLPAPPSLTQSGSLSDALPLQQPQQIPTFSGGTPSKIVDQNQQFHVTVSTEQSITTPDRNRSVQSPMPNISPQLLQTPIKYNSSDTSSVASIPLIPSTTPLTQQIHFLPAASQTPEQFLLSERQATHSPLRNQATVHATELPTTLFVPQASQQTTINFDDDEKTEPSSAANTAEQSNVDFRQTQVPNQPGTTDFFTSSIMRFVQDTRRRMGSKDVRKDSDDVGVQEGALISGYLQKYGRNGKWQTRWFETDGECLSYYKSSKRSKLLATLDLEKVCNVLCIASIVLVGSFTQSCFWFCGSGGEH